MDLRSAASASAEARDDEDDDAAGGAGADEGRGFRTGESGLFFLWTACCEAPLFWDWRATLTRVGLLVPWAWCEVAEAVWSSPG